MAAVGAALKKIAVAILSNPRNWKTIGGIILGIVIIVISPFAAVLGLLSGRIEVNTNRLTEIIDENLTEEQNSRLQMINDTMTEVEEKLDERDLSEYKVHAEVLYLFFLVDNSEDENFVMNFVRCFRKNSSNERIITRVNRKFGTEVELEEFEKMIESINEMNSETS